MIFIPTLFHLINSRMRMDLSTSLVCSFIDFPAWHWLLSLNLQLTAFLLMAVGSTISTIFEDFSIFMDDHFFAPATLMVVIAICLMIVAVTGCIGAIKESTMLVNVVSKSCWDSKRFFHLSLFSVCPLALCGIQHGAHSRHSCLHYARTGRIDVGSNNERILPNV